MTSDATARHARTGGAPWLVTGGAGYIGAHVVRALARSGHEVVAVDNLSTGLGSRMPAGVDLVRMDVLDTDGLLHLMRDVRPAGVLHLAGKKFPTESVADPLLYAEQNVGGVVSLAQAVRAFGGMPVVFSSSCSVYGTPDLDVVEESSPTVPESPYGDSKLYGERLLSAASAAYGWGVINLRYFNVVGAEAPGLGDTGVFNLVPLVFQAMREGVRPRVFGADYPTPDGTCVRDYVDVRDLADAHVRAATALASGAPTATYNIGRGVGSSVLDVIHAVREVTGHPLEYEVVARRPGDPARIVGSAARIASDLGWHASRGLRDMVASAWEAERPGAGGQPSPHARGHAVPGAGPR